MVVGVLGHNIKIQKICYLHQIINKLGGSSPLGKSKDSHTLISWLLSCHFLFWNSPIGGPKAYCKLEDIIQQRKNSNKDTWIKFLFFPIFCAKFLFFFLFSGIVNSYFSIFLTLPLNWCPAINIFDHKLCKVIHAEIKSSLEIKINAS